MSELFPSYLGPSRVTREAREATAAGVGLQDYITLSNQAARAEEDVTAYIEKIKESATVADDL